MEQKQLNLGLIGVGRIGKVHGEHLAYRIPRARLAAISDVNLEAAQAFGARLGVSPVVADHLALLNDPSIDAVVICSPTDLHATMIAEAAAAGKHIFCEKPIARTLKEIDTALDAVAKAGVMPAWARTVGQATTRAAGSAGSRMMFLERANSARDAAARSRP